MQAAQTVEDGICRYGFHPYQAPWILQSTLLLTLNIIFFKKCVSHEFLPIHR